MPAPDGDDPAGEGVRLLGGSPRLVPVVLATYPLLAGVPRADELFNLVFFVVLASVLVQGASVPFAARLLGLDAPAAARRDYPLEFNPVGGLKSELKEVSVTDGTAWAGRAVIDLELPSGLLIVLIARGFEFIQSSGGTTLAPGDTLLVLGDGEAIDRARAQAQSPDPGVEPDGHTEGESDPHSSSPAGSLKTPEDGG